MCLDLDQCAHLSSLLCLVPTTIFCPFSMVPRNNITICRYTSTPSLLSLLAIYVWVSVGPRTSLTLRPKHRHRWQTCLALSSFGFSTSFPFNIFSGYLSTTQKSTYTEEFQYSSVLWTWSSAYAFVCNDRIVPVDLVLVNFVLFTSLSTFALCYGM